MNNRNYPNQRSEDSQEKSLAYFVDTQRKNYKKGKLSQERKDALESIEGWDGRD